MRSPTRSRPTGAFPAARVSAWLIIAVVAGTIGASTCHAGVRSPFPKSALAKIIVLPDAIVRTNHRQRFTAIGEDASGTPIAFVASWSVVGQGGTIDSAGIFTAGQISGRFDRAVRASSGSIVGYTSVTIVPDAPPIAR